LFTKAAPDDPSLDSRLGWPVTLTSWEVHHGQLAKAAPTNIGRAEAATAAPAASPEFFIEEIDAGEMTPARLKDLERSMAVYGLGSLPDQRSARAQQGDDRVV
jgi:hypothetical protein